jgi:hypothetical protein
MKGSSLSSAALSALALLASGRPAAASELTPRIELELGFNTRSPDGPTLTTWAPNIHAFTQVDDGLALSATWGLATLDAERAESSGLKPLNPFIGVHLTPTLGDLRLALGFGGALPLAEARDPASADAYRTARAIRGSWDPWLYMPETFTLALPVRAELDALDMLLLAAEGAVFLNIGTRPGSGEQVGFQGALEAVARLGEVHAGLRVLAVRPDEELTQTALEPFLRVALGPVDLSGRLTMNLDRPDGFAFDREGIWGVRMGVGYRF